jgi:Na+-translocating ferredoxin:NAD+ oxidoreductase RnfD subunit
VSGYGVDAIMFNVVVALAAGGCLRVYAFGWAGSRCSGGDRLLRRDRAPRAACREGRSTIGDGRRCITGLLYGLTLPASLPLWMVVARRPGSMASASSSSADSAEPFNPALVGGR